MIPRPPGDGGFLFQIPRGTPGRGILKLRIPRGPRGGGFFKATGDGISILEPLAGQNWRLIILSRLIITYLVVIINYATAVFNRNFL